MRSVSSQPKRAGECGGDASIAPSRIGERYRNGIQINDRKALETMSKANGHTRFYRLMMLSCFTVLPAAEAGLAQQVANQSLNPIPAFRPMPAPGAQMPAEAVGAWQAQIAGSGFKLKTNYNIEIKINDGRSGLPAAIVSYFAGDASRPSTICRSQLTFETAEGRNFVFRESLNYKGGKDSCPIWDQVTIEPREGHLWLQWRDQAGRKSTIKMEAGAYRWTGGMECRLVSGDGNSSGQEWCRDADGNWSPKRR